MRRFLFVAMACAVLGCPPGRSVAQFANDDTASPAEFLVSQNPLLAMLERQQPRYVPGTIISLRRMTSGKREDGFRTFASPTDREQKQIATNPAFAAAYATQPAETLELLRRVNAVVEKAGQ